MAPRRPPTRGRWRSCRPDHHPPLEPPRHHPYHDDDHHAQEQMEPIGTQRLRTRPGVYRTAALGQTPQAPEAAALAAVETLRPRLLMGKEWVSDREFWRRHEANRQT